MLGSYIGMVTAKNQRGAKRKGEREREEKKGGERKRKTVGMRETE